MSKLEATGTATTTSPPHEARTSACLQDGILLFSWLPDAKRAHLVGRDVLKSNHRIPTLALCPEQTRVVTELQSEG